MVAPKSDGATSIVIKPVTISVVSLALIGTTPLILNRVSEKARHELLLPHGPKNQAERASTLKHDPIAEFRAAPDRLLADDGATLLAIPTGAIKGAMMTAALDMPGAKKAQIGRLVSVEGERAPIWGVPKVFMRIVRSADMNRTPDVRTRAILHEWATLVTVKFVTPILNESSVVNLLNAGGATCGLGDWRAEKGKGDYGSYRLTNQDDPAYQRIVREGGRAVQMEAMEQAEPYDQDTSELLEWFQAEASSRGKSAAKGARTGEA